MGGYGGAGGYYSKYTQQVSFREPGRTDGWVDRRKDGMPNTMSLCFSSKKQEQKSPLNVYICCTSCKETPTKDTDQLQIARINHFFWFGFVCLIDLMACVHGKQLRSSWDCQLS